MALQLEGIGENGATHVASLRAIMQACLGVTVTVDGNGMVTRGKREGETPEGQQTVTDLFDAIVGFTAKGKSVTLKIRVGSGQTNVTVDRFETREVDVGDLSAFPATPPTSSPNRTSRCEMLAHILAEYLDAMQRGHLGGKQKYKEAHIEGLRAQTRHRQRNGQNGTSVSNREGNFRGRRILRCQYSDGIRTDALLENNNITGFR